MTVQISYVLMGFNFHHGLGVSCSVSSSFIN